MAVWNIKTRIKHRQVERIAIMFAALHSATPMSQVSNPISNASC